MATSKSGKHFPQLTPSHTRKMIFCLSSTKNSTERPEEESTTRRHGTSISSLSRCEQLTLQLTTGSESVREGAGMLLGACSGLGDLCFASLRRPRPPLSPSSPCVPVLLTAAMDNPLASRLNLNLGTTGIPQNIHPMLSSSPRLVRADGRETRLSILHWPMTMIGVRRSGLRCRLPGGVELLRIRDRLFLSISIHSSWQILCPRISPHEKPLFASRHASPVGKLFRRIPRVDGGLSILR